MTETFVLGILVTLQLPHTNERDMQDSFSELELLADTAGVRSVAKFIQKKNNPDPSTYIGRGKMEEIEASIEALGAELVIFNDSLSPVQIRNLEMAFDARVIDRTQLILDIFAMRAQTKESKIQIELAQLQYLLPRLTGIGKQLSRLGGGIGTRGPGETKLETDRRRIRDRISDLRKELKVVVKQRELQQKRRKKTGMIQIALTGYTNAGKSTLLNRLTKANVLEENRLFATLDPTIRGLTLPSGIPIVLMDTVGFIQDLPTHLVAAFRSTLEVVKEADLILHVIDGSDLENHRKIHVVETLLEELGAIHIPRVKVFNKRDLILLESFQPHEKVDELWISAMNSSDVEKLVLKMDELVQKDFQLFTVNIAFTRPDIKAKLYATGYILEEKENIDKGCWVIKGLFRKETNISNI